MSRKPSKARGFGTDLAQYDDDGFKLTLSIMMLGGVVHAIANEGVELPRFEGVIASTKTSGVNTEGMPKILYALSKSKEENDALMIIVELLRSQQEIPRKLRDFLADQLDPFGSSARRFIFDFRDKGKGKKELRPSPEANKVVAQYVDHVMKIDKKTTAAAIEEVSGWFNVDPSWVRVMVNNHKRRGA
jgi:hypothetical protein